MSVVLALREPLASQTRRKSNILNEINRSPCDAGVALQIHQHRLDYPNAIHRPVNPTAVYNCHGLTFASRRTWIHSADEVKKILAEDDYIKIDYSAEKILPGDIIVYLKDGDIEHSGIVVEMVQGRGPRILSKWGKCHEVIHFPMECPWKDAVREYYRITT
jgi:hypothetical protein